MKRIENIRYNEEIGQYELICPFCHHASAIDWPNVEDPCEHVVYGHETINGELIICDPEWFADIKLLLIKHADELDMEWYIEDNADIDEDEEEEEDLLKLVPEYMESFVDEGYVTAEQIIGVLEKEGHTDILDRLVMDSVIEVASGDGTYYIFDSKDPNIKATDADYSYIKEEE